MYAATCPDCDWVQLYASRQSRWSGRRAHAARGCRPRGVGNPQVAEAGRLGAAVVRQQAETRDHAALAAAGLPAQRTEAEWVAHPTALDDLMRVMGGTSTKTIDAERRLAGDAA